MSCQRCGSREISFVQAKCSDLCFAEDRFEDAPTEEHDGYVPSNRNIGGGDYVEITFCRKCGQLQGAFPMEPLTSEE